VSVLGPRRRGRRVGGKGVLVSGTKKKMKMAEANLKMTNKEGTIRVSVTATGLERQQREGAGKTNPSPGWCS
jgi:hypothetical protein